MDFATPRTRILNGTIWRKPPFSGFFGNGRFVPMSVVHGCAANAMLNGSLRDAEWPVKGGD